MIVQAEALLATLPRPADAQWRDGVPFVTALRHGTMYTELCALRGTDYQTVHEQDELYFILQGQAVFHHLGQRQSVGRGSAMFVAAGQDHHFEAISSDFLAWVVFWGPSGGEPDAAPPLP